ncbi:MAG: hypothetical protein JW841_08700 [Deltaproteobacteria bacterium]|nr:hypothetical protein [Deltaproteobacteria bacterium]
MTNIAILKIGMFTPVGLDAAQTSTSVAAGLSCVQESSMVDQHQEPILAGLIPDDCLLPIEPSISPEKPLANLHKRILQLGGAALQEVLTDVENTAAIPVFVALPAKPKNKLNKPLADSFVAELAIQAQVEIDIANSKMFCNGRAGFFLALKEARQRLASPQGPNFIIVGGVDSYLDPYLISHLLIVEKRILATDVFDGFRPGEGAAFLLLASENGLKAFADKPLATLAGIGIGSESGHLFSSEPYLGEGLSQAFDDLFANTSSLSEGEKVQTVFAGFNGEHLFSKEWGVGFMRHHQYINEKYRIEHPAECFGDAGAALPAIMAGCAAAGLQEGDIEGPVLLWAASDGSERGAACFVNNREGD